MLTIDIVLVAILLIFLGFGVYFGFLKAFFLLFSILVGGIIANKYYVYSIKILQPSKFTYFLAFLVLFILSAIVVLLLTKLLTNAILKVMPSVIDKILGSLLFLFLGILFLGAVQYFLANLAPKLINLTNLNNSKIMPCILKVDGKVYNLVPAKCKTKISQKISEPSETEAVNMEQI